MRPEALAYARKKMAEMLGVYERGASWTSVVHGSRGTEGGSNPERVCIERL